MQDHPYFNSDKVLILAHRGGTVPTENTLEAFKIAIAEGADIIETDVQVTKDGKAILFHDATLDRVVDWQFGSQYEEIFVETYKKSDVWRESMTPAGVDAKPPLVKKFEWSQISNLVLRGGSKIATLEDALKQFPTTRFNIDIKANAAIPDLVATIERLNAHDRVLVSSFSNRRRLRAIRMFSRPVATSSSASTVIKIWLYCFLGLPLRVIARSLEGIGAMQIPRSIAFMKLDSPRFMSKVLATGTKLHYWTINNPQEMLELTRRGATGIVSDVSELAVQTLRKA